VPERQCRVRGEFDIAAVADVRAVLRRAINEPDLDVLVDCAEMTFIDSNGVAALLEAEALLRHHGRKIRVVNVPPRLHRAFEILGVLDLLLCPDARETSAPTVCERPGGRPRKEAK